MSPVRTPHETYAGYVDLTVLVCPTCGILYAIPEQMRIDRYEERGKRNSDWYCPNGHMIHYPGKTHEEEIQELKNRIAAERSRHDQTRAALSAQKGVTTKERKKRERIQKRISAGVCPCCNRTFQQLARHMKSKHPEYLEENEI